jgi:mRNA-degrading endonuclease YafQ of YafQ-DinJ toxin-antitoxin module
VVSVVNWQVKLTDQAEAELKKLLSAGLVTKADVKILLLWVDEMEEFGPSYIAASKDWHDHELEKAWTGYRSSAFSKAGRVIYKVRDRKITVEVHRVTADHNYKK